MAILKDLIVHGPSRFIGGIFGSKFVVEGGTSSLFLKADGSLDSNTYATLSWANSNYLPITGGTLATDNSAILTLDNTATSTSETGLVFKRNRTVKAWVGYHDTVGAYIYNAARNKYLAYTDSGALMFEGSLVIHSGNISSYAITSHQDISGKLDKAGGTMTGVLSLLGNQFNAYDGSTGALNCNNSDIYNVNSILTADLSESWKESIGFKRSNGNYDTFRAADGTFYFGVNSGTEYTAVHSGNIGSQSVNYATSAGSANSVAWGNITGKPSSLPASDVYSWAKQSSKPSYHAGELGVTPTSYKVTTVAAGIAPYISDIGTNIFAGATTSEIKVERSTDNGSTWTDVTATEVDNVKNVFSGCVSGSLCVSGRSQAAVGDQLRITFNPSGGSRYCTLAFIYVYFNTSGCGCYCNVEKNYFTNQTSWYSYTSDAPIAGWPGPNIIGMGGTIFGQNDSRNDGYGIRLTFRITSVNSNYDSRGLIYSIQGFTANRAWGTPSNSLAKTNTPYTITDADRRVTFDNSVTASGFIKSGSSSSKVLMGDGSDKSESSLSVNYATSAGSAPASDVYAWAKSDSLSTAINGLSEGSANATRNDYIVAQYTGGGTTTTSYHRRKLSNIFAALSKSDITTALGYTPPTSDTNTVTVVADTTNKKIHFSESSDADINFTGGTNKFTVSDGHSQSFDVAITPSIAWGSVTGKPSSMPASDVYSWAKLSTKPSYSFSEISGSVSTSQLPSQEFFTDAEIEALWDAATGSTS